MSTKKENLMKLREAGRIAASVMSKANRQISKGKKLLNICESLEKEIKRQNAKPSFPVNISVNQIAAHYTSPANDDLVLPERSVVKIDLGTHIDGFISDHAKTFLIDPNKTYTHLKDTAELALEKAIEIIEPGIRPAEIGEVIETTIRDEGLVPVTDLTGHEIKQWQLHGGTVIPNFKPKLGFLESKLKAGQVIAVEPFVTTSDGSQNVYDESYSFIFSFQKNKAKTKDEKKVIQAIKKYRKLPFAIRWLEKLLPETRLFEAMKGLVASNSVAKYPMLVSKSQTPVAQAEHTVLITNSGCEILTVRN